LPYIPNRCQAAIGELDDLANLELLGHDAQLIEDASPWIWRERNSEFRVEGGW
jgi:hypothetical protein